MGDDATEGAMNAIDAIRAAPKIGDNAFMRLSEMSDAPLGRPGPWARITRCGLPIM